MVVIAIVPVEKGTVKNLGILDTTEPLGELQLIFHGLEVVLGKRIVVGGVGPAVRLGHAKIGEQKGGGLGLHGRATVGMQCQLAARDRPYPALRA